MLRKFGPNQVVGLQDDPAFVGVITGPLYDRSNTFTGSWVVGVSNPGSGVYRGQAQIEERLLVERSDPPLYTPPPRGVRKVEKARALAQEHAPAELSR